jgi:hypothetical protein
VRFCVPAKGTKVTHDGLRPGPTAVYSLPQVLPRIDFG